MHELFIFIFFLLSLVFFFILRANQQSPNEIIARYIDAIGGEKVLEDINRLEITGVLEEPEGQNFVLIEIVRNVSFSIAHSNAGQYGKLLLENNQNPSYVATNQEIPEYIFEIQRSLLYKSFDTLNDLYHFKQKGYTAFFTGTEMVDGSKCYKILLRAKDASTCLYLIDVNSYLLIEQRLLYTSDETHTGQEIRLCIQFTNYKNYDGFLFPGKIRIAGEQPVLIFITNIKFNFSPLYS